jgi:CheY-like chemotaxis protein
MTANAMAEDRAHCLASGMDDFISKPIQLKDVSAMLHRWLPVEAHSLLERPSALESCKE